MIENNVTEKDFYEIFNITSEGSVKINTELTLHEIKEFMLKRGYRIVKTKMLVDVEDVDCSSGEAERSTRKNVLHDVVLCLPLYCEVPKSSEHIDHHKDKEYFTVVQKELNNHFRDIFMNQTNTNQISKPTCPDCGDKGWLYDNEGRKTGTCPCHY